MDIKDINGIKIPYITKDNKEYYPLGYLLEKILLRNKGQSHRNKIYKPHIINSKFDFSFNGGGIQNTYCISTEGLMLLLKNIKIGTLKDKNIYIFKSLCEYFKVKRNIMVKIDHNEYIKDSINEFKIDNAHYETKYCVRCGDTLPSDEKFFIKDNRTKDGLGSICRECSDNSKAVIKMKDLNKMTAYRHFGIEGYILIKNNKVKYYFNYIHNNKIGIRFKINDKYEYLDIVKYAYKNKLISEEELRYNFINNNFKFTNIPLEVKNNSLINEYCSDNECQTNPYKYPNYKLRDISYEKCFEILNNYILENNIVIKDILSYSNYYETIKKSGLTRFINKKVDTLEFIVGFYNKTYPGYKFKLKPSSYYNKKENRVFDMKWLIEKDLKIPIEKIPLYITKYSLQRNCIALYHILKDKNYYNSLFEWINECYPDRFIETDFNINPFRSIFDSLEEAQIHDILKQNFDNVIYNQRNSEFEININNNMPDWTIFTDNGVYLVEYFGLYQSNIGSSSRLKEYKRKMDKKFKKYNEVSGYKFLFIYPEDIKYNYNGLKNKIQKIKEL